MTQSPTSPSQGSPTPAMCVSQAALDEDLIHKALANPFRREILKWLKTPNAYFVQGSFDVGCGVPLNAIHARSGLSQSTVSAHVAALIEARLLVSTRVGQWMLLARCEAVIHAFAEGIKLHL
ncbi:DNA-binding transcriptional ArsR family regulator [Paraburkholderia sp. GAS38]